MQTRSKKQPLLYDREVEKTAKKNRKQARESKVARLKQEETVEAAEFEIKEMANANNQGLVKLENETDAAFAQRLINVGRE